MNTSEKIKIHQIQNKKIGSGGIRTHASEETGALNQRLRPLGHATIYRFFPYPRSCQIWSNVQFKFYVKDLLHLHSLPECNAHIMLSLYSI